MDSKKILYQLNIPAQCKKYGISVWQYPPFIFLIMGFITIISIVTAYFIGTHYIENSETVALLVILLAAVLLVLAFVVTKSFEKLAEANRMKSEFVSVVSHQLRSPLSNLRWVIEILMSGRIGKIEEDQIEYFKILRENCGRMRDLVSNLLTVSRIDTATLPIKNAEFSFSDLVREIVKRSEIFAKASNVILEVNCESNPLNVIADSSQTSLVVDNLLDNAIKYTKDKGTVKINVKEKGKNLYFEITDSGVGIPQEDQKYIFQKFFRSQNAAKHQTQGSGLGLYIAKAIIEKTGGKIGFKSQEGVGSTFWFTLPIK
jgi:signal transduction histidine kinase